MGRGRTDRSGVVNRTVLDPSRVENAERRVRSALQTAAYHAQQAQANRVAAEALCRTWGLDLSELSAGVPLDGTLPYE